MDAVIVIPFKDDPDSLEVVERKGLGHPDTICDALAENLSRNLCREYRRRFGAILHHNVDKALLSGGRVAPAFGGGAVLVPIRLYLAGRAVGQAGSDAVPIREIAIEGSRRWLGDHLRHLDPERHVLIEDVIEPGSQDLQNLFERGAHARTPVANDTSFGVGHAPLSPLEALVLRVEGLINGRDRSSAHPCWGEDVKVMAVRSGSQVRLTIACAMIGTYIRHLDDYRSEASALRDFVRKLAAGAGFPNSHVVVNAGDDLATGSIYLTVTGTSAEAGDDGQVGRGNRVNGLITPCRPMSLEAAAGKNPVSHVGKIYNVLARDIAESLVATIPEIEAAQCLMVSRMGTPVSEPAAVQIKLATRDRYPATALKPHVEEQVAEHLRAIPQLTDRLVAGATMVF